MWHTAALLYHLCQVTGLKFKNDQLLIEIGKFFISNLLVISLFISYILHLSKMGTNNFESLKSHAHKETYTKGLTLGNEVN